FEAVRYLGFPFSLSETFQQRNTNSSINDAFITVKAIRDLCAKKDKELVVYLSMGFGNPYGDPYSPQTVVDWSGRMADEGIKILSVADTVGLATAPEVFDVMKEVIPAHPGIVIGVHLHSAPHNRAEKLDAALKAGCTRFDSAIKGIGGCPMAGDALVGNMDTEFMISHFRDKGLDMNIDDVALSEASMMAAGVFI
ncbi:MAG: hydroxymethylglutaryl-CoA lyase, partial [Chitinophagaceae bacterium]